MHAKAEAIHLSYITETGAQSVRPAAYGLHAMTRKQDIDLELERLRARRLRYRLGELRAAADRTRGITGPEKYARAGITFTTPVVVTTDPPLRCLLQDASRLEERGVLVQAIEVLA
jgi:hypothetical protein